MSISGSSSSTYPGVQAAVGPPAHGHVSPLLMARREPRHASPLPLQHPYFCALPLSAAPQMQVRPVQLQQGVPTPPPILSPSNTIGASFFASGLFRTAADLYKEEMVPRYQNVQQQEQQQQQQQLNLHLIEDQQQKISAQAQVDRPLTCMQSPNKRRRQQLQQLVCDYDVHQQHQLQQQANQQEHLNTQGQGSQQHLHMPLFPDGTLSSPLQASLFHAFLCACHPCI